MEGWKSCEGKISKMCHELWKYLLTEYTGLDIAGGEKGEVVDKDGLADQIAVVNVHAHLVIRGIKWWS